MASSDHQMHPSDAVPGRVCAALFSGYWHRGEIVQVNAGLESVMVHFIDYGTTSNVRLMDIKYLLREFAYDRGQAHRGCLDYISPVDGKRWCRDSTYAFLAIVQDDVILFAKVTKIDWTVSGLSMRCPNVSLIHCCSFAQNRVVRMILINTQKEQDLQINVHMVDEGYAKVRSEPILVIRSDCILSTSTFLIRVYVSGFKNDDL